MCNYNFFNREKIHYKYYTIGFDTIGFDTIGFDTIGFDTRGFDTTQPRHPTAPSHRAIPPPHIAHYIAPNTRKREMSRITGNE